MYRGGHLKRSPDFKLGWKYTSLAKQLKTITQNSTTVNVDNLHALLEIYRLHV